MEKLEKVKPLVRVVLDGRERTLVYNFWALGIIQEEKGDDFIAQYVRNPTTARLFYLTWAGLLKEPGMDSESPQKRRQAQKVVFEWCEKADQAELLKAVTDALIAAEFITVRTPAAADQGAPAEKNADGEDQEAKATETTPES